MKFISESCAAVNEVEELKLISQEAGLNQRELLALLNTDLEVPYLLEYLSAVVTNRLN